MKKRTIVIVVVLLALALTITYFVSTTSQREVLVLSSIVNTVNVLNSPAGWKKWNPALKEACDKNPGACAINHDSTKNIFTIHAGQDSVIVEAQGASFNISQTKSNRQEAYNYTILSSIRDDSTKIIITENRSLLLSFLSQPPGNTMAYQDALSLKKFIETPSAFYGFPLEITGVVDTNVVIIRRIVPAAERAATLADMYKSINSFIGNNHLKIMQPGIVHYELKGKDSIDIMAGIAVDRIAPAKNNISCIQLPKGRLLVGYYKGSFEGRKQLYQAMNNYVRDKFLRKIATSFEKYLDNKLPENDSSQVELKVYYPVL